MRLISVLMETMFFVFVLFCFCCYKVVIWSFYLFISLLSWFICPEFPTLDVSKDAFSKESKQEFSNKNFQIEFFLHVEKMTWNASVFQLLHPRHTVSNQNHELRLFCWNRYKLLCRLNSRSRRWANGKSRCCLNYLFWATLGRMLTYVVNCWG